MARVPARSAPCGSGATCFHNPGSSSLGKPGIAASPTTAAARDSMILRLQRHRSLWTTFLVLLCVRLLSLHCAAAAQASDFAVKDLPGLESTSFNLSFAGLLPVSGVTSATKARQLFFWYFKAPETTNSRAGKPLLFWFPGGPGCSSVKQVFSKNGPLVLNTLGGVTWNDKWSWTNLADVVYVDSPYGTGFSHIPTAVDVEGEGDEAKDMQQFLQEFGIVFPELYQKEVYLAGQGYAGVTIPHMAQLILESRRHATPSEKQVNLRSIALANGFVAPLFHFGSVLRHIDKFPEVSNKLSERTRRVLKGEKEKLTHHLYHHEKNQPIFPHQWVEFKELLLQFLKSATGPCFDWHDILKVQGPGDCEEAKEEDALASFMNDPYVLSALHVPQSSAKWVECRTGHVLQHNTPVPSKELLRSLLNEIRIVFYNADLDMYANHVGMEEFLRSFSWGRRPQLGWQNSTLVPWGGRQDTGVSSDTPENGSTAVTANSSWTLANAERDLVYLRVLGSGYDSSNAKPEVVYKIFEDFVFRDDGIREVEAKKQQTELLVAPDSQQQGPTVNATAGTPLALAPAADAAVKPGVIILCLVAVCGVCSFAWYRYRFSSQDLLRRYSGFAGDHGLLGALQNKVGNSTLRIRAPRGQYAAVTEEDQDAE